MNQSLLFDDLELALDPVPAIARQCLYRFIALALLDPRRGAWEQLNSLRRTRVLFDAAALERDQARLPPGGQARGERPLEDLDPQKVLVRLPDSPAKLNEQYEAVFGLLVSSDCPPTKPTTSTRSLLSNGRTAWRMWPGFIGRLASTRRRNPPSGMTISFCSWSSWRTCLGCSMAPKAIVIWCATSASKCRVAQRRFLAEHLAWWAPAFATLLARRAAGSFYEAAAQFLSALVPAERALLDVAAPTPAKGPSPIERPEECDGCAAGSITSGGF